ncbi:MAG: DUF262 domain-containing protein [Myxococcota bacterium]|nr:DUF262 domain-containing protein [Myxococcota bacterium]
MSNPSPFVPLEHPPQAISLTVRALLTRVQQGRIRIPPFQRPLRWLSDDVVKLFDSIRRGYPVGSLLFWKRHAPADEGYRIGTARLPVGEVSEAWWIVDGQQRVTALAAALLELDHGQDARWLVKYDPGKDELLSGAVLPIEAGLVVPLSTLGDLRRLGKWLQGAAVDDVAANRVEQLQQRILDYELSAYVVETDNRQALKGVFARVNSSGVRMHSDEVFHALFGESDQQLSLGRSAIDLNHLQRRCDLDSFGEPPRLEVMKAVLAMSGLDPTRRFDSIGEASLSKLVSLDDAEDALVRAVDFLQGSSVAAEPGAGIPCYSFIPYPVVFVVLAQWFHRHPKTASDTRRLLAQWLWRGASTGVHQRAAVSSFRDQLRLIRGDSEVQDVKALLSFVAEPPRVDWTLRPFQARNAASRVELLALLDLCPRDRTGPVSWRSLVSDGERVAREIVRSSKWKALGEDGARLARTVANRVLLDAAHTGLETELLRWDPMDDRAALESHLIDAEMWKALKEERVADFLRRRAARVQTVVSSFLTKRAGIGAPRLMALDRYADTDPDLDEEFGADASPGESE